MANAAATARPTSVGSPECMTRAARSIGTAQPRPPFGNGCRGVHREEVLEVHWRMYEGVARKPDCFDYRIDARLVRVVRNLETPAGYPLAVRERRPNEMLYPC